MTNIVLTVLLLLCHILLFGQSHFGITSGIDCASIQEAAIYTPNGSFQSFEVFDKPYSSNSLFFGVRGEKQISESVILSIRLSYTKKEIEALVGGPIVPSKGLRFKIYGSALSTNYCFTEKFNFGIGPSLTYIPSITIFYERGGEDEFPIKNRKEMGVLLSTSYRYKSMLVELYFNKGLSFNDEKEPGDFKPINSIGFSLSYLFQVAKGK